MAGAPSPPAPAAPSPGGPRPVRLSRVLRGLAAGLGAALLALVLVEGGLRLFAPQGLVTEHFRYEALPGGDAGGPGYRLQPGLFLPGRVGGRVNGLGLRGPEVPADDGRPRLVVLGDSFVYGAGVAEAETFAAGLADAVGGRGVVLNAGTPGYGTARALAWLETFGDELAPDLVLLAAFVGNDVTDNLDQEAPRIVDGRLFLDGDPDASATRDRLVILRNRLHLWRLWERARHGTAAPAGAPEDRAEADAAARAAALERVHDTFARQESERLGVYLPRGAGETDVDRRIATGYAMTELALEGLAAWCAERDVALGVVLIPDVVQVDARLRERVLTGVGLAEADLDWERPQRELATMAAALPAPVVDLRASMAAAQADLRADGDPSDMGLYLLGDSHWSAAGHAHATARLVEAWRAGAWGVAWGALVTD